MSNWKAIPGYEKLYEVNDVGLVKSLQRQVRHRNHLRTVNERILKQRIDTYGYACVGLYLSGRIKWHKVHRLVMLAFIGPSTLTVNHRDMNKLNNALENLEYMSNIDNIKASHLQRIKYNLPRGENHHKSKLSDSDVLQMKSLRDVFTDVEIAHRYGIHPQSVNKIIKRRNL